MRTVERRWRLARKSSSNAVVTLGIAVSILAVGIQQGLTEESHATFPSEKDSPWEKGFLRFGGYVAAFNSDLGFGIDGGPSVAVDGEGTFGLDASLTVLRLDGAYRPGESRRHQVDFTYAAYHRKGKKTISEEIDLGDQTIPIGAEVSSIFNFDIIRSTYTYAFLQDDRMRVAMGLGIYVVPLEYGLDVETSGGREAIEGAEVTLPLPAIALRAEFLLVPKVYLNIEANFMYLAIDDFTGSLMDNTIGVEYRPWKHFGLGLAYSGMSVAVEQESSDSGYPGSDFVGSVDVQFNGLFLYGKASF